METGNGVSNRGQSYGRMEFENRFSEPPPMKTKHLRRCFTSCFRPSPANAGDVDSPPRSLLRSLRSKVHALPENLCKCSGLSPRRNSVEFKYDPLSYSLNFDEGAAMDESPTSSDQFRYRCFSSRLPLSPPRGGTDGGGFDGPN